VNELDLATVDRLLTTTRAVRRRLDLTRPVPRDVVLECLRLAIQAPTGSNAQLWRWLVIEDAETRAAIAELYRNPPGVLRGPGEAVPEMTPQQQRMMEGARFAASLKSWCIAACTLPRWPSRWRCQAG